ncbi:MAG: CoA transferase, partial [Gammaproteobacteria bacterium]
AEQRAPDVAHERALGGYAMYGIYPTKDDRHVVIGGSELHFAEAILDRLGRPDLLDLCRPPPGPHQEPVKAFLRETFLTRTRDEWVRFFDGINAAFAPVNTLREAADDPQIRHREMVVEDARGWEHIGTPLKFRHEPGAPRFEFAALGEHTEAVLESLGYDAAARATMKGDGVF